MKFKALLMFFFLLTGSLYLQAQSPHTTSPQTFEEYEEPGPQAPCASVINFKQECNEKGEVVITFNVRNNTSVNVSNVWVYLDDNTTVASLGGTLPPGGTSSTITYSAPLGQTNVCFNIRLLNTKGVQCCYTRRCFNINECPCGEVGKISIKCKEKGTYEFCFNVYNPSYSTNTIDVVMLSSSYPDLCIDGSAAPAPIAITPVPPGSFGTVCVVLEGCSSTIPSGNVITVTPHLLEFADPNFCCDQDPISVTTPSCCDRFSSSASSKPADCDMSNGSVTINVSGGTAPYSLTGVGPGISFLGTSVTRNNLAAGTYHYIVTDANGCKTTGTITVKQSPCLCDNINDDTNGGQGVFNQTYTADGDGFLCFTFDTHMQPDRIQISIDGTLVEDSGLFSTDFTTAQVGTNYPNCTNATGGGGTPFSASIPINTGQQITILITGSACSGPGTLWDLHVDCQSTPCGLIGPNNPSQTHARLEHASAGGNDTSYREGVKKRKGQMIPNKALQVFPNPVRETLIIKNSNSDIQFETINILDTSGKIIKTDRMSKNTEINVDVSSLPRGIYFINAMDSNGNKVTERFVKVK